jgi:hypothetical protein
VRVRREGREERGEGERSRQGKWRVDLIDSIWIGSVNQKELHDLKVMEFRSKEEWSHFVFCSSIDIGTVLWRRVKEEERERERQRQRGRMR